MVSINVFRAADYTVLGTAGAVTLAAGLTAIYALPWRCCRWQHYDPFNTFWRGKVLLELILGSWAALQILRLALLWGPYSIVAPESVTNWTGAGWLCRIYLTAALGIAAPLSSWFFLLLLAAGKSEKESSTLSLATKYYYPTATTHSPQRTDLQRDTLSYTPPSISSIAHLEEEEEDFAAAAARQRDSGGGGGGATSSISSSSHRKIGRAFVLAFLCTLPIALLQTAAAWISQFVKYQGEEMEKQPRTLLGYFFAVFWYGKPAQCNSTTTSTTNSTTECTLCTFTAASAIIHLVWTFFFLFCLWTTAACISAAALNRALQKRLRILVCLYTVFSGIGCACLGVSVVEGPFTWINQGVWLGYVATVAATVLLLSWEVVVVPVHSSHVAARRSFEWEQGGDSSGQLTYAQAVVASPDFPPYVYHPYSLSSSHPHHQQQQQEEERITLPSSNINGNYHSSGDGGGFFAVDGRGENVNIETSASASVPSFPLPFPPLQPPYCQVELATQPPISARKSHRLRLFSRASRASSRIESENGGGGGENLITARDVLADTNTSGSVATNGGGVGSGTLQMLPSPFMTPPPPPRQQHHRHQLNASRSKSPSGGGAAAAGGGDNIDGSGSSSIPALYNRYYSSNGGGSVGGGVAAQGNFLYRPSSAASSTAGSVGSGRFTGSQGGRSSWPITPPSPTKSGGTPSIAALHLASYYQPHWQQQQQQRGLGSRPSTASSTAPPSTVSPIHQPGASYGGSGSARVHFNSQPYYSSSGGGLGLGLFGLSGLGSGAGGGGGSRYYHSPSFGRAQETTNVVFGTPASSGTATPTPQSAQQLFPPPPWR